MNNPPTSGSPPSGDPPLGPDEFLSLISYRMADTGRFVQGPYASMKKQQSPRLDVAARLTGNNIEVNTKKLAEMGISDSVVQMMGLIFHQALMHMDRRNLITAGLPQYQAPADLAAELAVWHKLEHPSQPVSKRFPKPGDFGYPEGLSMEQYFKLIVDQAEKQGLDLEQFMQDEDPQQGQGQGGSGSGKKKGQGAPQKGKGKGQPQQGEGDEEEDGQGGGGDKDSPAQRLAEALGSQGDYHKQDHQGWNQVSSVQQEAMAATVPDKLEAWMKSRGIEPAGLKRLVDEIRQLKRERWYDKLRRLVGTRMASVLYRHTIKRPSRRLGVPFPGRVKQRKGVLAVAIDTSGSIDKTELTIFIAKLHGIAKNYEAPFEVIVCDADIHSIKKITSPRQVLTVDLRGGGGTSSLPVFEYLKDKHVDMLVYLTDLYIDFPSPPPTYKVIWGVVNRKEGDFQPAPFGETYHLDVEDNPQSMGPTRRHR